MTLHHRLNLAPMARGPSFTRRLHAPVTRRCYAMAAAAIVGFLAGFGSGFDLELPRLSAEDGAVELIEPNLPRWETTGKWTVDAEGVLHLTPKGSTFGLFPDYKSFLWSDRAYKDFDLELEFRVPRGGKSGIFFRASSLTDYLEVQLADSAGKSLPLDDDDCGGLVDYVAPSSNRAKPAGQWNKMRIRVEGEDLQVWLNGADVLRVDLDARPETRGLEAGRLAIQDQSAAVSFRNIKIRDLGP